MTEPTDVSGETAPSDPSFEPPFDQRPADQQPSPVPRPFGAPRPMPISNVQQPSSSSPPPPPPAPSTAGAEPHRERAEPGADGEVVIRPLDMTAPSDLLVDRMNGPDQSGGPIRSLASSGPTDGFLPLRSEPPPRLVATWWLRVVIFLAMSGALASVLLTEYFGEPGDVRSSSLIAVLHLASAGALVAWSYLAIHNSEHLVPASRYKKRSSGTTAVALWLLAFAAPAWVLLVYRELSARLDDPDDFQAVCILVGVVLTAFVLVWLPFRYHARHATRVGAPHRTMFMWFFAPLIVIVGCLVILAMGLRTMLADGGLTATERTVQVGVAYGLPMLVFLLSTIRAVTVVDEVVDLRWRRWKAEWEQTLQDFVAQPQPGPEGSPSFGDGPPA